MCKEKGIEDAIEAVKLVNTKIGWKAVSLDIYGPVNNDYQKRLHDFVGNKGTEIQYKGVVSPNKSVDTIIKYDVLLFPTYYEGEGLPGTLLDAFASGVIVIATKWKYNPEFIENQKNGFLTDIKRPDQIADNLFFLLYNSNIVWKIQYSSRKSFEEYSEKNVITQICDLLE